MHSNLRSENLAVEEILKDQSKTSLISYQLKNDVSFQQTDQNCIQLLLPLNNSSFYAAINKVGS